MTSPLGYSSLLCSAQASGDYKVLSYSSAKGICYGEISDTGKTEPKIDEQASDVRFFSAWPPDPTDPTDRTEQDPEPLTLKRKT